MFNRYIKHRAKREAVEETLPGAALHILSIISLILSTLVPSAPALTSSSWLKLSD